MYIRKRNFLITFTQKEQDDKYDVNQLRSVLLTMMRVKWLRCYCHWCQSWPRGWEGKDTIHLV